MTVITYRHGIMACDSCWATSEGLQEISLTKIRRLKSGALLGGAGEGDSRDVELLLENVKHEKDLPLRSKLQELRLDWTGLLVLPNGHIFTVATSDTPDKKDAEIGVCVFNRGFAAVGTGAEIAIGAMAAGKTAYEAARIVCDWDIHCRAPIHAVALRYPPKQRKAKR
jgi:ATP-dependent protease HslVU (ClpYQ) peptidase subunit